MTPEQLSKPCTNFDFDDEDVLNLFLAEIRTRVAEGLDMTAEESENEFSDVTLLSYLTEHNLNERDTCEEAVANTVNQTVKRFNTRPMSGHEDERERAMSDDPVGLARDRQRFGVLNERRKTIREAMEQELAAATGKPPRSR